MTDLAPIPPAEGGHVGPHDAATSHSLPRNSAARDAFKVSSASPEDEVEIRDLLRTLRRRWRTIAATVFGVTAVVAAYVLLVTPTWQAQTLILVDDKQPGQILSPALTALTGLPGGGQIETEMRLAQTRPVMEDVVDALDLNFVVTDPRDLARRTLFEGHDFGRETVEGTYEIRRVGSGDAYRIRSTGDRTPPLDATFSPGERVPLAGGWFVLGDLEAVASDIDLPDAIEVATVPFQRAVTDLSETIWVERVDRDADVLQVAYRSTDRTLVHEVPNTLGERFIIRRIQYQKTEAMSTVAFLEGAVEDTRQQLERVESELQAYLEDEQIVALGAEAQAQVSRLATLQGQRTQLEAERSALATLLGDIESGDVAADYRRLASFPRFFDNEAITQLLVKLIDAEQTRTSLLTRFTASHPDVVALETRIDQLEGQLGSIGRNYLQSLGDQLGALNTALAGFGADLERIPEREIVAARIRRQVSMLGELYTVLQTRLKEAQVNEAIDDSSVRIVESAIEPLEPVSPRPVRALALALMLGLVLGIVLAFAREYMDRRLDSDDRLDALYGVPTMARIPAFGLDNGREGRAAALVTLNEAGSLAAESFRVLRANVGLLRSRLGADDLLITSPAPGEGKSITAANLSIALAQAGVRTVLVDADMRSPVQHAQFGVDRSPGLAECLLADELVAGSLRPTTLEALALLPAGARPQNPAELLDSPAMDRLLASLRDRFEAIVLDAPPVLSASDSTLLAPRMDGVILVVRAGKSEKDAIAAAIEQMGRVDALLLGMVVNDATGIRSYYSPDEEAAGRPDAGTGGVAALLRRIGGPFA